MSDESVWQKYSEILKAPGLKSLDSGVELPELLFHYTSAESCFLIIQTPMMSHKGPRIWASCALGMNDAKEIRYGMDLVHEVASQFVPKAEMDLSFAAHWKHGEYARLSFLENTCVACFCDGSDLLSQWRAYGRNGTGYCLGFRRNPLSAAGSEAGFQLVPIIYNREQQIKKIRTLFEEAQTILEQDHPKPEWKLWRTAINIAIDFSLAFKHASFSEEREWRLIATNPRALQFRPGRWGVIPYVEIQLPQKSLAEIWQGPTLDHDLTRRTLEMYLVRTYGIDHAGESKVQIRKSEIAFRKLEP